MPMSARRATCDTGWWWWQGRCSIRDQTSAQARKSDDTRRWAKCRWGSASKPPLRHVQGHILCKHLALLAILRRVVQACSVGTRRPPPPPTLHSPRPLPSAFTVCPSRALPCSASSSISRISILSSSALIAMLWEFIWGCARCAASTTLPQPSCGRGAAASRNGQYFPLQRWCTPTERA